MNRQLLPILALVVMIPLTQAKAAGLSGATQTALVPGANVQELLQWADTHNPELAAMRYEIDAARERILPAASLPDPTLRATFMDFAGPGAPDGFNPLPGKGSGTQYRLGQTFPWWGKRDLRKELATAELEQVKGRRGATVAEIHARIKSAYAQYYQAVALKKLNEEILHLLTGLESTAQVRYASGLVPQQDVIRAQVEKTTLRAEIINLDTEHHHAMTKLNVALGRPQLAPIAEPQALRRIAPEKLDGATLQEKAARANPLLATQSAQVSAADANRRLVERNRYPDVTLMIAPTQRDGNIDSWEAMVEINLPIRFDTRRSQESEAAAMLAAAKERQQAIENLVVGNLQESLAALEAAGRQEQLITDTLLPQAELTFRSALAGYENGEVDFATMLDAQRAIWRAKQDRIRAQVEQEVRLAEIERIIGEAL
ncbi:Cobalt-zinc-cadmium resistance protein CzcC [Methylophilaceae bacterium]|nr:Cobalt-zinc-cadmium resistance protein CzcC [Methylophilaceae bacterium]